MPASSFKHEDALAIFAAPLEQRTAPGFAPVLKTAGDKLMIAFGDVSRVLRDPEAVKQLLLLPQAALLYLVNSDALLTDIEDSVLVMVSWWLEGEVGKGCSDAEATELREAIRYSHLSVTYLAQVLHRLPRLCPTQSQLLELLEHRTLSATIAPHYFAGQPGANRMPAGWLRLARGSYASTANTNSVANSVTIPLDVSKSEVEKHITDIQAAQKGTDSPPAGQSASKLCNALIVTLNFTSRNNGKSFIIGIQLHAPLPAYKDRMVLPRGTVCEFSVSMQGNHTGYTTRSPKPQLCPSAGIGMFNFPQKVSKLPGDPMSLAWWAPLLIDGHLRFSTIVTILV